jgi:hypothetical protein
MPIGSVSLMCRPIINAYRTRRCIGEGDEGSQAARRIHWESVGIALQCGFGAGRLPAVWKPLAIEKNDICSDQRGDRLDQRR